MTLERGSEADDAALIREVVAAQFRSLNWSQTRDPGWAAFARGFVPDARLFPAARPVRHQTVEQFIERMNQLRAEGKLASFEEALLGCEVRVFGNVAVAFAGCEMLENGSTVTRDVSAILLVRDAGVWRVVAQAWDLETDTNRIPDALARGDRAR